MLDPNGRRLGARAPPLRLLLAIRGFDMVKGADGKFPTGFTPDYVEDDVPALPVPARDCTFSPVVQAFNAMITERKAFSDTVNILDFLLFWGTFADGGSIINVNVNVNSGSGRCRGPFHTRF